MAKKTAKKGINVPLLRKVQKFLLAEPRRFYMDQGVVDIEYLRRACGIEIAEKAAPPCGTTCCIAGATYILGKNIQKTLNFTKREWETVRKYAVRELGLQEDEAERLFYIIDMHGTDTGWPMKFCYAYANAKTPLQRAKVGVARIEHFIKTNGAE